ncbi:hypothetical protein IFM89_028286 [Coptis chinensis]|uniref:DUF4283 domain-containing protein n=1 Tax=Coptis chinensis TaxID=261450 RepID=A0A835HHU4_9MAGN|nr:hypothetical protein IFM89_028286 [Coptis chinensis]
MCCRMLKLPARLDGLRLAHHGSRLLSDVARREMVLDAVVDVEGTAKVLWWAHKFNVHVDSHLVIDPVFLDVIEQEIPRDIIEEGISLWKDHLVGFFVEKRLPFPVGVHSTLDQELETQRKNMSTLPIWVKLWNMPKQMWTKKGISFIASRIGKPICRDAATQKKQRLDFARVCIEVTRNAKYPDCLRFDLGKGIIAEVGVEYLWIPLTCSICNKSGHKESNCRASTDATATDARMNVQGQNTQRNTHTRPTNNQWVRRQNVTSVQTSNTGMPISETGLHRVNAEIGASAAVIGVSEVNATDAITTYNPFNILAEEELENQSLDLIQVAGVRNDLPLNTIEVETESVPVVTPGETLSDLATDTLEPSACFLGEEEPEGIRVSSTDEDAQDTLVNHNPCSVIHFEETTEPDVANSATDREEESNRTTNPYELVLPQVQATTSPLELAISSQPSDEVPLNSMPHMIELPNSGGAEINQYAADHELFKDNKH